MYIKSYRIALLKTKVKYTLFFASYLFYKENSTTKKYFLNYKKVHFKYKDNKL